MREKTCCVTGSKVIPADKMDFVRTSLREEIKSAVADGYTTFISGFGDGVELLFAELVIEEKALHPELFLEAAIPYSNRIKAPNPLFRKCIAKCDGIRVQQGKYSRGCVINRNRYMVTQASRVIAVHDGHEKGDVFFAMRYAQAMERELRDVRI